MSGGGWGALGRKHFLELSAGEDVGEKAQRLKIQVLGL